MPFAGMAPAPERSRHGTPPLFDVPLLESPASLRSRRISVLANGTWAFMPDQMPAAWIFWSGKTIHKKQQHLRRSDVHG